MAKKSISKISFDSVASPSHININNDDNDNIHHNLMDDIEIKTKNQTHSFRGFYIENELVDLIDRLTAGKGRGAKSNLVNRILKDRFKEEGLL